MQVFHVVHVTDSEDFFAVGKTQEAVNNWILKSIAQQTKTFEKEGMKVSQDLRDALAQENVQRAQFLYEEHYQDNFFEIKAMDLLE